MARIRSLHPGQWTDEDFVLCSPVARLLCLALRNEADDNGVFEWKPVTLKMRVLPNDAVDMADLLAELVEHRQIVSFEVCGKRYGAVRNFCRFQRPKKPNPIYPLPNEFRTWVGLSGDGSEPVPHQPGTASPKSPQMKEEGGNREGRKEEDDDDPREAEAEPTPTPASAEAARRIEIGHRVIKAMGADPARWAGDFSIVTAWLNAGYDPDLDIVPAVRVAMARKADGLPPKALKYFTEPIRRAHRERTTDLSAASPGGSPAADHWASTLTPAQIERMNANIRHLAPHMPSAFTAATGIPIHDATAEQVEAFVLEKLLDIPEPLRRAIA